MLGLTGGYGAIDALAAAYAAARKLGLSPNRVGGSTEIRCDSNHQRLVVYGIVVRACIMCLRCGGCLWWLPGGYEEEYGEHEDGCLVPLALAAHKAAE